MELKEFHSDLLEQIKINDDSYNLPSEQSLFFIYSDFLHSSGQVVDDEIEIEFGIEGYNFSAFSRDRERGALNLFVSDYRSALEPEKIYQKDLEAYFNGLTELISNTIIPAIDDLDPSNPICEFANDLCSENKMYKSLTIWKVTNGLYSSRSSPELVTEINGVSVNICHLN